MKNNNKGNKEKYVDLNKELINKIEMFMSKAGLTSDDSIEYLIRALEVQTLNKPL